MKITSDENVNQAVEQMVQAIRNTDAYLEYQKQLARVKEQSELKRQIDEFRTRNFELQTSKDTNFDKLDQFIRETKLSGRIHWCRIFWRRSWHFAV